jgi:hypothetical protein
MKTTYSQFLLCCMILCGLFTLSNCKDDCAEKKIPLKDLQLYVPYNGNDTLRFLRNSTDTQIFVGQGLERFYVTTKKQEDDACPEDHESVRIRFKNTQNNNEIKMEYIFYYKESFSGGLVDILTSSTSLNINGYIYNSLSIFSLSKDTLTYVLFRFPYNNEYGGILKLKYPQDTLTLIR